MEVGRRRRARARHSQRLFNEMLPGFARVETEEGMKCSRHSIDTITFGQVRYCPSVSNGEFPAISRQAVYIRYNLRRRSNAPPYFVSLLFDTGQRYGHVAPLFAASLRLIKQETEVRQLAFRSKLSQFPRRKGHFEVF